MRTNMFFVCFTCVLVVSIAAVSDIYGQTAKEKILEEAESRLRAIYERKSPVRATPGDSVSWLNSFLGVSFSP